MTCRILRDHAVQYLGMKTSVHVRSLLGALLLGTVTLVFPGPAAGGQIPGLAPIPAGQFEMGDHHGFVDPKHGGDETPIHTVRVDAFHMGINTVTTGEYCDFLTSSLRRHEVEVRVGGVYLTGGKDLLCETRQMSPYSRIGWDGQAFSVLERKQDHPIVCIRWAGAAAYCNWLSASQRRPQCYNPATWDCDFNKTGFRLPTEAEWEFAARGGLLQPYRNYPWGDEPDASRANWPESRNPFRNGPQPWTTPVGFFNGSLHQKTNFAWPGAAENFQTSNGANGYGLHDMAGNVWQFVNDWYSRDFYSQSPTNNPAGPASGSLMPDGKPYRGMRGGNWYNGENGHSRVSNRNPSYFRGPQDPDHPYYHIGFRVVLPVDAESRPLIKPTPIERDAARERRPRTETTNPSRRPRPQGDPRQSGVDKQRGEPELNTPRTGSGMDLARNNGAQEANGGFSLMSPEVSDGGSLPAEFTADGASATLPLTWTNAPAGTTGYAVIMHHEAPDRTKWYWIVYNIPAEIHYLPKNARNVGTLGINSVNARNEYAPPRSKGPGPKTYVYTVYALSSAPKLSVPPTEVDREVLLAAMKDRILGTAKLSVVYSRPEGAEDRDLDVRPPRNPPPEAGSRNDNAQRRQRRQTPNP